MTLSINPQVNTFKSLSQTLFYRPENPNLKNAHHLRLGLSATKSMCLGLGLGLGLGVSALDRI